MGSQPYPKGSVTLVLGFGLRVILRTVVKVEKIIIHEEFKGIIFDGDISKVAYYVEQIKAQNKSVTAKDVNGLDEKQHDIALVKLKEYVDLQMFTPVCLPKTEKKWEGKKVWLVGWGDTENSQEETEFLQEVNVAVKSNERCQEQITPFSSHQLTSDVICVQAPGKGLGHGDSGGPATVDEGGQHVLIGVNSYGSNDLQVRKV